MSASDLHLNAGTLAQYQLGEPLQREDGLGREALA
jgi:hypothetical protein